MDWSIKQMLQPVITRLYIYGMNPIDLERVFKKVEETPLLNTHSLEITWAKLWEEKATEFRNMAIEAEQLGHLESAKAFRGFVTHCEYARFLINSEDMDFKKAIYDQFERDYEAYTKYLTGRVQRVAIPFSKEKCLPGYLHIPEVPKEKLSEKINQKLPCIVLFAGEGSCKEELNTLARAFVERGIVALAWDAPGTGASLFKEDVKTSYLNLKQSFKAAFEFVKGIPYIDENAIGACGLCMGGGYAYYAAAQEPSVKCCINLFPLLITQTNLERIPRWMKQSKWANYQREEEYETFLENMKGLEEGTMTSSYLIVAGKEDNWMSYEAATKLYEKAKGDKKMITIDEESPFSNKESMLHAMPVGEQMHWLKHVVADWACTKLTSL